MGATAEVVGLRQAAGCKPVVGQTDDYLVARVRAGDDAAFEKIYDRYARGMLAFCVHMLGSREAAEDALQLTFVSAYRTLRGGESNISLRPWLYTIARNRCLSELRTRRDGVDVDGVAVGRRFFEGVADQVQRREELREILEDMQRLPVDQRAALVLFELGDHSHEEIACVLGVRREKVKALIFQAREALVRGRHARNRPCAEIRERLATLHGRVLPRSITRAHIDRCPSCASFEEEMRRQRAALALILPVALTGELKASVLGSALRGGGAAAAGAGACGGGGGAAAASAGACGSGAVVASGTTAAGGAGGAGAVAAGAGAAGSLAAGTGAASTAVVAGAPVAAAATALTAVGECAASVAVGGLGATGVVAKILTAAAIATGAAGASHASSQVRHPLPGPATALQIPATSASPATAPTIASTPTAADGSTTSTAPAATPTAADGSTTSTAPAATPTAADGSTTSTAPAATPTAADGSTTSTAPAATPTAADGSTTSTAPAATPTAADGSTTSTAPAATPTAADGSTTSTAPAATPTAADGSTTSTAPAATPTAANTTTAAAPSDPA